MRNSKERDVVFLNFEICSDPIYAGRCHLQYFVQKVQELVNDGFSDYWNKKKDNKIYIRKMEIDGDIHCVKFLLCYNDSTVPSIPVADIDTDEQRNEKTAEREGSPHTAHLIIKSDPIQSNQHVYSGLLEEGEHLKRRDIEKYFNFLFKQIQKKYPDDFMMSSIDGSMDRNGRLKREKYSNFFEVQGKLSKDFQQILNDGKIRGLTLVSDQVSNLVTGDGSTIQPRRKELALIANSGPISLVANALREACQLGKQHNYEALRISFSNGKNLSSSVMISTADQNVLGDGFLRKERLGDFSLPLPEAAEEFNDEIINKMLLLM